MFSKLFLKMEDRKLTEKESLEVITSMIARTKQRYIGNGNIMLMWGYVCVAVCALVWIMVAATHNPSWNWLWFLIWIIGGTLTPIMSRKLKTDENVKNYSDRITSQIWSVVGFCGIALTAVCLGFLFIKGVDTWSSWFVFALIIVPFAEIAQGIVFKEKSLIFGGCVGLAVGMFSLCCIIGRITLYARWFMPLFMLAFVCMMVIPGHILNHKAKLQR